MVSLIRHNASRRIIVRNMDAFRHSLDSQQASSCLSIRNASSSTTRISNDDGDDADGTTRDLGDADARSQSNNLHHRRVWKSSDNHSNNTYQAEFWDTRVGDKNPSSTSTVKEGMTVGPDENCVDALVRKLSETSKQAGGGRMRQSQLGVLHQDPATDMQLLIDNYTVKAVASALRDREDCLQQAAILSADGKIEELQQFLQIFHPKYVLERRQNKNHRYSDSDHTTSFDRVVAAEHDPVVRLDTDAARQVLRKALMRMPRVVTTAHSKRAAVCLALCTVCGVPSLLLEKRAAHLRAHPDEVCLVCLLRCCVVVGR